MLTTEEILDIAEGVRGTSVFTHIPALMKAAYDKACEDCHKAIEKSNIGDFYEDGPLRDAADICWGLKHSETKHKGEK